MMPNQADRGCERRAVAATPAGVGRRTGPCPAGRRRARRTPPVRGRVVGRAAAAGLGGAGGAVRGRRHRDPAGCDRRRPLRGA